MAAGFFRPAGPPAGLGRAFDHSTKRQAATSFAAGTLPSKLLPDLIDPTIPSELKVVAGRFKTLPHQRHAADDNLLVNSERKDVVALISEADRAIEIGVRIRVAPAARLFLVALLVNDRTRE